MIVMDVDTLVLGTGIAGLSFALRASKFGNVAVVTKKSDTDSSTNNAQGGIAAVLSSVDSYESHIRDTHVAGAGLCREDAVDILVHEGPARVLELADLGVRFTRGDDPTTMGFDLGREGGHSTRRIVHAADLTGREIERVLVATVKANPKINIFEQHYAIDLLTEDVGGKKVCRGASVLNSDTGEVIVIRAKITMLATGGSSKIYLHTTNPDIATGDGVAMAYRAGAVISNMEFIQFHPTTLYSDAARNFLISEAVRGEGGILRLKTGEAFMSKYHAMADLAPRDIVARAIDNEMKKSGEPCVYLDVTGLSEEKIKEHFPYIRERCLEVGIDIAKDLIPIVPAAHYTCGGVWVDTMGRTTVENLYACGEVSCTGVHGANRLASNSLLEAIVFAKRSADDAAAKIGSLALGDAAEFDMTGHADRVPLNIIEDLESTVRTAMWEYVGIVRTDKRLNKALQVVDGVKETADRLYETGILTPSLLELRNMAQTAKIIIMSALRRKESRGLHYSPDYPYLSDKPEETNIVIGED